MSNTKRKAISIILLFIVSTMLIGILSACTDVEKKPNADTTVEPSDQTAEAIIETELTDDTTEPSSAELIKFKSYSPLLTEDEAKEIVWAYIKDYDPNFDLTYSVKCWGKTNGAYAVIVDSNGWGYLTVQTTEVVNGVTFIYPDSRTLKIYYDGKVYSVLDAFENKIISAEFVYDLSLIVNGLYSKNK